MLQPGLPDHVPHKLELKTSILGVHPQHRIPVGEEIFISKASLFIGPKLRHALRVHQQAIYFNPIGGVPIIMYIPTVGSPMRVLESLDKSGDFFLPLLLLRVVLLIHQKPVPVVDLERAHHHLVVRPFHFRRPKSVPLPFVRFAEVLLREQNHIWRRFHIPDFSCREFFVIRLDEFELVHPSSYEFTLCVLVVVPGSAPGVEVA
mmetsp:Transcript_26905/g.67760  ORF Transcript_26905/g.67760 Transcript_26905/m.67760 type:complete len:204 (-) Transcript_26905:1092-1703(-)